MKTARAHRKFAIYSTFLDTILEGEEPILDGETRKDTLKRILKELEETAAELRKEAMPHLHGENGVVMSVPNSVTPGAKSNGMYDRIASPYPYPQLQSTAVIDYKLTEELEISIDNAQTIDELKSIKEQNPIMPAKLIDHYNKRLKQLTK